MKVPTQKKIIPERLSGANPGLTVLLARWKARDVHVLQLHTSDAHAGDILRDCATCAELFEEGQRGADEIEQLRIEREQRIAGRVYRGGEQRG